MGGFSIWHFLVLILIGLLWVPPLARLFRRVGHSPWWSILGFIPLFGVVLIWILAFAPWKIADANEAPLDMMRS